MKTLEQKMQLMCDSERKNRDVAIQWLKQVTETLTNPCYELLGNSAQYVGETYYCIPIQSIDEQGERLNHDIYFRYETHRGTKDCENPGFYMKPEYDPMPVWGEDVIEIKGRDFWRAIKTIKNWLPIIESDLEKNSKSRMQIVEKLLVQ